MSKFPAVFVFVLFRSILVNTEMGLDHCRPRVANERASEHATFQISNCERPFSGGPSFPLWLGLVETAAIVRGMFVDGNVRGSRDAVARSRSRLKTDCAVSSLHSRVWASSKPLGQMRFTTRRCFPAFGPCL